MISLIVDARRADPEAPALVSRGKTLSYGELAAWAQSLARGLKNRSLTRVALVVSDPATSIALLAAASAAGCEACSYAAQLSEAEVEELAQAFGHAAVVTDRVLSLSGTDVIDVSELGADGDDLDLPESMPLLVLTTGTTARPKAARHDWQRLMEPARRRSGSADERWLLAFNLNQFAGLQVLLHVMASGGCLVIPDSIQPRDALDAMRRHGVTHLSATPTFWRFLVALLGNDAEGAPPLVQATLGGEAASEQVLDDIRRLFPRARVSHVYASTEAGSGVSVTDGLQGLPVSVLERGPDADVQFRIVDGQLEVRSNVGMFGYLGAEDDAGADAVWRATGDLVEIRGDRICFVGRSTETINVGGVKVHPLTIEEAAATVPGVHMAHAYARSNPVSGQIVALDVVADPATDREELEDRIRAACESLPPAAQPRRIRFVEELALRENKVARSAGPAGAP